jgi:nucleoid-associated protein YgaU
MPDGQAPAETAQAPEPLEPVVPPPAGGDAKGPADPWPSGAAAGGAQQKLPGAEGVAADPPAAPAAAEPTFRTIKVQAGDTLAIIAKRELGSAARYAEIMKANPGLVASKLRKGQEIKIPVSPAKAAPDQTASRGTLASPVPAPSAAPPAPEPTPSGSDRIYVVKAGDTLSAIAGREMGSKSKWAELQRANEDVLHGSTSLKVGMKLHIPGGEKSSGTVSDAAPVASATETPSGGATEHEYIVKPGDSLWLIAKNELGSEKMIGELREANSGILKGSDSLKVGTKLTIPAKH